MREARRHRGTGAPIRPTRLPRRNTGRAHARRAGPWPRRFGGPRPLWPQSPTPHRRAFHPARSGPSRTSARRWRRRGGDRSARPGGRRRRIMSSRPPLHQGARERSVASFAVSCPDDRAATAKTESSLTGSRLSASLTLVVVLIDGTIIDLPGKRVERRLIAAIAIFLLGNFKADSSHLHESGVRLSLLALRPVAALRLFCHGSHPPHGCETDGQPD